MRGEEIASIGRGDVNTYRWSIAAGGGGDGTTLQGDRFSVSVSRPLWESSNAAVLGCATLATDTATLSVAHQQDGIGHGGFIQAQKRHITLGTANSAMLSRACTVGLSAGIRLAARGHLHIVAADDVYACIEQYHEYESGPQGTGGAGFPIVGLGARLSRLTGKAVLIRSWIPKAEAATLLQNYKTRAPWLQRRFEALGWRETPLIPPSLQREDPRFLSVGDEMVITTTRTWTGGLAAALAGALLGGYHARQNVTYLAIRRTGEHVLEAAVTTRTNQVCTVGFDIPIVANAFRTIITADAACEVFSFDLRERAAQTAFEQLRAGIMPNGTATLLGRITDLRDVETLWRAETLPEGVDRLLLEWVRMPAQTSVGGGVASPWYLPFCNAAALEGERRTTPEGSLRITPAGIIHTERREAQRSADVVFQGASSCAPYVAFTQQLAWSPTGADILLDARMGACYHFQRFCGRTRFAAIERINKNIMSHWELPHFIDPDRRCAYTIAVERSLRAEDFKQLATPSTTQDPARLRLQQNMRQATGSDGQLEALFEFLCSSHDAGLGAVHRTLGGDDRLWSITPHYPDMATLLRRGLELRTRLGDDRLSQDSSAAHLKYRISEVAQTAKNLAAQHRDVRLDPLLALFQPTTQHDQEVTLQSAYRALVDSVRIDHLPIGTQQRLRQGIGRRAEARRVEVLGGC